MFHHKFNETEELIMGWARVRQQKPDRFELGAWAEAYWEYRGWGTAKMDRLAE